MENEMKTKITHTLIFILLIITSCTPAPILTPPPTSRPTPTLTPTPTSRPTPTKDIWTEYDEKSKDYFVYLSLDLSTIPGLSDTGDENTMIFPPFDSPGNGAQSPKRDSEGNWYMKDNFEQVTTISDYGDQGGMDTSLVEREGGKKSIIHSTPGSLLGLLYEDGLGNESSTMNYHPSRKQLLGLVTLSKDGLDPPSVMYLLIVPCQTL